MPPPEGIRKKSEISHIIYPAWKLRAQLDSRIQRLYKNLMDVTFASGKLPGYQHPFGSSESLIPFLDMVCYRLPDHVRAEGGLGLHIDRNPLEPFKDIQRFRPIQSFIALVDHYGSEHGGIKSGTGLSQRIR